METGTDISMMKLAAKQIEFKERVLNGENVYLTGKAGTGKTHIVKEAIKELQAEGKHVVALAPTGIAANNLGGQTLHSFFKLTPYGILDFEACQYAGPDKKVLFRKADVIVIDEISMLRADIFDATNLTLLKNGCGSLTGKQIILVGDMKQLPAVATQLDLSVLLEFYRGVEFFHAAVYPKLNMKTIELDEIQRQSDPEFIENLNIVRDGGRAPYFKQFIRETPRGVILAPHNLTVMRYNEIGLNSVQKPAHIFTAMITGNIKPEDFNIEREIVVKHGCPIMYLANSQSAPLVNGTIGIFIEKGNNYFIQVGGAKYALEPVKFSKKEYTWNPDKQKMELKDVGTITQHPIKLAYALTIHKSQGLTFPEVTIDLTKKCFAPGQLYTAMSRVTGPAGLTIIT